MNYTDDKSKVKSKM